MAKKILSTILVVMLLITTLSAMGVSAENTITDTKKSTGTQSELATTLGLTGSNVLATDYRATNMVAHNDKYIFVVQGLSMTEFMSNSVLEVYERTEDTPQFVGYYALSAGTVANIKYAAIRDIAVDGNVLYVAFNYAKNSKSHQGVGGKNNIQNTVYAFDVSNVTGGGVLTGNSVEGIGTAGATAAYFPYNRGGTMYFDSENNRMYAKKVTDIYIRDFSEYSADGTTSTPDWSWCYTGISNDVVQIYTKDGYMYNVLQKYNGLNGSAETTQVYNQINVYAIDESSKYITSSEVLYGTYTAGADATVINDVVAYGDYMYVATSAGLDVVKRENLSGVTAMTPTTNKTTVGTTAVNSLEVVGTNLFAATDSGVVIYSLFNPALPTELASNAIGKVYDISVDTKTKQIFAGVSYALGNCAILSYNIENVSDSLSIDSIELANAEGSANELTFGEWKPVANMSKEVASGLFVCAAYKEADGVKELQSAVTYTPQAAASKVTFDQTITVDADTTEVKMMYISSLKGMTPFAGAVSLKK